jgi:HTH-type transcriptional regulator, competence development regulator
MDLRRLALRPLLSLAVKQVAVLLSTVVIDINCRKVAMAPAIGRLLKRTRQVRALSATEVARAAGISAAYLSKLENDAVKKPSPPVLHQLSAALAVPYAELMRLSGYPVPGEDPPAKANTIGAALFADITEDERDELLEYLAWYRTRHGSPRGRSPLPGPLGA